VLWIFQFLFFILDFLKLILQELSGYRIGTITDFHWGFKPLLSHSKPHTFSTVFGEEKEKCIYSL